MTAEIKSRKPTGRVPFPFILVEGEEKSGKSWAAAALSASEKVGTTYWVDLGEGAADEYGAIPGARYEVIDHDGTYADILAQILAVKAEAQRAADAGEPPVVLVIDSLSTLWESLKDWVTELAKGSARNKAKLAQDPAADVDVSRNLWNLAGARYRKIITALLTFPGIVIGTARGKEVSATDPATGQPYRDGRKDYRVEGHRTLPFDATVWVRMSRTSKPLVVGARSVHAGIKPGADDPQPITGEFSLERLVFDLLKCDPGTAHARDLRAITGGELTDEEKVDAPEAAPPAQIRRAPQTPSAGASAPPADAQPHPGAQVLADLSVHVETVEKLKETVYDPALAKKLLKAPVMDPETKQLVELHQVIDAVKRALTTRGAAA